MPHDVLAQDLSTKPWMLVRLCMRASDIVESLCKKADKGLPVVSLPISFWSDGFQTFLRGQVRDRKRSEEDNSFIYTHGWLTKGACCGMYVQHSTCTVAWLYASAAYAMRMSRAWMKIPAFVPKGVDHSEVLSIIFHPLRELEYGEVMEAAVPGGKVLVKSSLFTSLADAPQQAVHTHTKGNAAKIFCQTCLHPSDTIIESAEVGSHSRDCTYTKTMLVCSASLRGQENGSRTITCWHYNTQCQCTAWPAGRRL